MANVKLYFNKENIPFYKVQVRRKGVHISKCFDDEKVGEAWAKDRETEIRLGHLTVKNCAMPTMGEALERYRKQVSSKKRSAHAEGYIIDRIEREDFMDLPIDQVSSRILSSMRDRRLREVGAQRVRHELGLLRHLYNVARSEWGFEDLKSPFANFKFPKPPQCRTRRLKSHEMTHFLNCLNEYQAGGREFQLFVKWQAETAMRRGESLTIKWKNVDWDKTEVFLPITKNGESRIVPLGPDAIAILLQLRLNPLQPFEHLTERIVEYHWRRLVKISGFENFHLHDLRRDAISRLSEQGLMPQEVQKISGHKSLGQLMTYLAVDEKRVVDKLIQIAAE